MFTCTVIHLFDSKNDVCSWEPNRRTLFGRFMEQVKPAKAKHSVVLRELTDEMDHYVGTGDKGVHPGMHKRHSISK